MQTRETTPFLHWKANVTTAAGVSVDQANVHMSRIELWFDAGEDADDAAAMLKLFCQNHVKAPVAANIAKRWYRNGRRVF